MSRSSDLEPQPIRRRVYYSGNVQGVGFRYSTRDIARRFAVTGFVRNLEDGRVELIAEGEPPVLDAFLAAVNFAMRGHIFGMDTDEGTATGEFPTFVIAR